MKVTIPLDDGDVLEFDLPEETVEALKEIAERNGLTLEAALRSAIENENMFEELAAKGKLLVRRGNKLRKLEVA